MTTTTAHPETTTRVTHVRIRPVRVRPVMLDQAEDGDLPAWVRVGCLAWARSNARGHAVMERGDILRHLDLSSVERVTGAIATARTRGWLDAASHAGCLVLPGYGSNPCRSHS